MSNYASGARADCTAPGAHERGTNMTLSDATPPAVRDGIVRTPTTGQDLHYRDWGGSGRPILLLHGLASSSRIWDLLAPRLRPVGRVVALDQRGHGASGKPDGGYDFATIVGDVAGAAQALDLVRPVVIGHSWGAAVALAYAAATPACPGAALIDGGVVDMQAQPDSGWDAVARRLAPPDLSTRRVADITGFLRSGPLADLDPAFVTDFVHSLMAEQSDGTVRPRLTRARHMAILRQLWEFHPAALLPQVACPLLVILAHAPADRATPEFDAAKRAGLAALAGHPHVETHVLPDTLHDIPLHRPEALAALIAAWLSTLPPP